MLLAAIDLNNLSGYVAVALVIGAAISFRRGGGGTAIASLEAANRVLERRVHDLEEQGHAKDKEIAELRGRTDVSIALAPMIDWTAKHEQHASDRHKATLAVLELIAARLGQDPEARREP
jgi:hypothetical protein